MNARFWVLYKGSPVKLTMEPGEKIETYSYSRTEEGYATDSEIYEYDGVLVVRDGEAYSRDCG